jgi:hypothetical protein
MCETFAIVELSHDTFTFFTDDILFSMLQNYLNIFLFCDRFSARARRMCMVTSLGIIHIFNW